MEVRAREVLMFPAGNNRFMKWLERLSADLSQAVDARITRIRDGNFGDHRTVGAGVYELRIHKGPGLRVYYGMEGDLVVLLTGGSKKNQSKDIKTAKALWRSYRHED